MLNRYNKPANMRDIRTRNAKMVNPLSTLPDYKTTDKNAMAELERVLETFLACDSGKYRGPFKINSPCWFAICFESQDQREKFREQMHLKNHGVQYWNADAFTGTLEILKSGTSSQGFGKRDNPFAKRAMAKKDDSPTNAEKYSNLRAETKKTAEKLKRYTEDGTWIAICANDDKELDEVFNKLKIAPAKYVHIEDVLSALESIGITLDVPIVDFGLRPSARPDKALLQFTSGTRL